MNFKIKKIFIKNKNFNYSYVLFWLGIGNKVMSYLCIMDAILYQNNFLAGTNTAKHDLKYISTRDISKMNAEPIIIVKSHFTIKGELNESEPLMLITEGLDNSFFCIFVRTIDNAMELKPKRKLTQQEVKKYKRIWQ